MTRQSQADRLLLGADRDLTAWTQEPDEHGNQRHRSVVEAARHRASWSPEYRAKLYAEWEQIA